MLLLCDLGYRFATSHFFAPSRHRARDTWLGEPRNTGCRPRQVPGIRIRARAMAHGHRTSRPRQSGRASAVLRRLDIWQELLQQTSIASLSVNFNDVPITDVAKAHTPGLKRPAGLNWRQHAPETLHHSRANPLNMFDAPFVSITVSHYRIPWMQVAIVMLLYTAPDLGSRATSCVSPGCISLLSSLQSPDLRTAPAILTPDPLCCCASPCLILLYCTLLPMIAR